MKDEHETDITYKTQFKASRSWREAQSEGVRDGTCKLERLPCVQHDFVARIT